MSLYNGPPRGGSRGGKDQFNWSAVKADKDREYYLGHSVKALTGRWQKGKDVYWYTRDKNDNGGVDEELQRVKAKEQQLMDEALGLKPKSDVVKKRKLEDHEMEQLLQRTGADRPPPTADDDDDETDKTIRGLGYAPRMMGGVAASTKLEGFDDTKGRPPRARTSDTPGDDDRLDDDQDRHGGSRDRRKDSDHERKHKRSKRDHSEKDRISKHSSKEKKRKKEKKEKKEKRDRKDR